MKKGGKGKTMSRPAAERSAGVLVFREDANVSGRRLFLLLDYGKYWDYPKGHVEQGEDDRAAAVRELAEETGITDARFVEGFGFPIVYFFRHPKKGLVRKTVMFFLASTATERVRISEEHTGHAWVAEEGIMAQLKYPTARKVFRAAVEYLGKRHEGT